MTNERVIVAIGRMERALSRLEQVKPSEMPATDGGELAVKFVRLKAETRAALEAMDAMLTKHGSQNG